MKRFKCVIIPHEGRERGPFFVHIALYVLYGFQPVLAPICSSSEVMIR